MSTMKSYKVLDLMFSLGMEWPQIESHAVENKQEFRKSGWHWDVDSQERVVLISREEDVLHKNCLDHYKARQYIGDPNAHESVRTPDQPAWNGDGLPPVGAECLLLDEYLNGSRVVVRAYSGDGLDAAVEYKDCRQLEWVQYGRLTPIKSDKDKAVEEMVNVCMTSEGKGWADVCCALYRAGFRKQGVE